MGLQRKPSTGGSQNIDKEARIQRESAQLNYRLLFLFLRNRTPNWPGLGRGGKTMLLWVFLLFLRKWDLRQNYTIVLNLSNF